MDTPPNAVALQGAVDPWAVLEAIPDALAIVDASGRVRFLNGAWRRLDRDAAPEPMQVGGWFPGSYAALLSPYPPGAFAWPDVMRDVLSGRSPPITLDVHAAAPPIARRITISPCLIGQAPGALLIQRPPDDTAALHALLRRKDLLLRETHHRVRNNLQVIASLLDLQALAAGDERVAEALADSQQRVQAIALVHEQLQDTADSTQIDFAAYVRTLVESLAQLYPTPSAVRIEVAADELHLDATTAVSCGLIVNELVVNALKHAFPSGRAGLVRVECRAEADGQVALAVSDTGVGMPDDALAPGGSLGLTLTVALAEQLHGTLSVESGGGATVRVVFTPPTETSKG